MKDQIEKLVNTYTENQLEQCSNAVDISKKLGLSRNLVSQYLNELYSAGVLIKINTRPVIFYGKKVLETQYNCVFDQDSFKSMAELQTYMSKKQQNVFERIIGYNSSLSSVVDQCKAIVSYPQNGLPALLYGPTGTGKSMIAQLIYDYAVANGYINKERAFITVNCSEYANNPELLTANLFGHKKGAYTGAVQDNLGLLHLADGGLLFLDEVHCLSPECQEKLFLFMDKGTYHMVGNNEKWYHANIRLVFATTEDPEKCLLKTLRRRIPFVITIPSLNERGIREKIQLISHLLHEEERKINRDIFISNSVYNIFISVDFPGNIGELKNAVSSSCANAFSRIGKENGPVHIFVYDLPDYITNLYIQHNLIIQPENNTAMIGTKELKQYYRGKRDQIKLNDEVISYMKAFDAGKDFNVFLERCANALDDFFDHIVFHKREGAHAKGEMIQKILENTFEVISSRYRFKLNNNDIYALSCHILDYLKSNYELRNYSGQFINEIQRLYQIVNENIPRELQIAQEIAASFKVSMDVELDMLLIAITAIHLKLKSYSVEDLSRVGIILAHGYSTASSIADSVNKLLGHHVFDAIDMPLNVSSAEIAAYLNDFLLKANGLEELILLVDMGSLENMYEHIDIKNINIGIINNITTKIALEIADGMLKGRPMQTILKQCSEEKIKYKIIHNRKKEEVILFSCASGIGTAEKLRKIFQDSIPAKVPVKLRQYDYTSLLEKKLNDKFFTDLDVIAIVGTISPQVDGISFISIEKLFTNEGMEILEVYFSKYLSRQEIQQMNKKLIDNFSLSNIIDNLTILNANKLIEHVSAAVEQLEALLDIQFSNAVRHGLNVHLCCMIERLVIGQDSQEEPYSKKNVSKIFETKVKEALTIIEKYYHVSISPREIEYIHDYVHYFSVNSHEITK